MLDVALELEVNTKKLAGMETLVFIVEAVVIEAVIVEAVVIETVVVEAVDEVDPPPKDEGEDELVVIKAVEVVLNIVVESEVDASEELEL